MKLIYLLPRRRKVRYRNILLRWIIVTCGRCSNCLYERGKGVISFMYVYKTKAINKFEVMRYSKDQLMRGHTFVSLWSSQFNSVVIFRIKLSFRSIKLSKHLAFRAEYPKLSFFKQIAKFVCNIWEIIFIVQMVVDYISTLMSSNYHHQQLILVHS